MIGISAAEGAPMNRDFAALSLDTERVFLKHEGTKPPQADWLLQDLQDDRGFSREKAQKAQKGF